MGQRRENRKYFQVKENENITYQNLWNASNAVLTEKFITVNATLKKKRGSWMAQSVKHPALGFSSGHDLQVHGFKPQVRHCTDRKRYPLSLSLSLSLSLPLSLPLPLPLPTMPSFSLSK